MQESAYKEFTAAVTDLVQKFKLGDGLEDGTTLGPLINAAAVDRVSIAAHYHSYLHKIWLFNPSDTAL